MELTKKDMALLATAQPTKMTDGQFASLVSRMAYIEERAAEEV